MKIVTADYSMATRSLDIFFSGCLANPKCTDCHNPESWSFDCGKDWTLWKEYVTKNLQIYHKIIDRIFVLGGEPLDQDKNEFKEFINWLDEIRTDGILTVPVYLFTRYELIEIDPDIRNRFEYIKTGAYKPELSTTDNVVYGVRLATSNQTINKRGKNY